MCRCVSYASPLTTVPSQREMFLEQQSINHFHGSKRLVICFFPGNHANHSYLPIHGSYLKHHFLCKSEGPLRDPLTFCDRGLEAVFFGGRISWTDFVDSLLPRDFLPLSLWENAQKHSARTSLAILAGQKYPTIICGLAGPRGLEGSNESIVHTGNFFYSDYLSAREELGP